MILFELRCAQGHAFEAWFRDSATYEQQAAAGDITCAICGDREVRKALMAPAVSTRGRRPERAPEAPPQAAAASPDAATTGHRGGAPAPGAGGSAAKPRPTLDPERVATVMRTWRKIQQHIEKNFEPVGNRFAEEARKIHYGETEQRRIYGEATATEAKELQDEGIEIDQVPWPIRHDS